MEPVRNQTFKKVCFDNSNSDQNKNKEWSKDDYAYVIKNYISQICDANVIKDILLSDPDLAFDVITCEIQCCRINVNWSRCSMFINQALDKSYDYIQIRDLIPDLGKDYLEGPDMSSFHLLVQDYKTINGKGLKPGLCIENFKKNYNQTKEVLDNFISEVTIRRDHMACNCVHVLWMHDIMKSSFSSE